jgi:uncharacterized membrane protein YvbJ
MICPRCGKENNKDSSECIHCFYKFSFGYGYDDPAKGDPWSFSKGINNFSEEEEELNPTRSKIITIGLILMALAAGVPIIIMLIMTLLGEYKISY